MGDTFRKGVRPPLMSIKRIVEPVGMWESRRRFPRWVGRVGILVLDFHSFQAPSFPQAFWFPAVELMLERVEPANLQGAVKNFVVAIMAGPQTQRLSAEDFTHEKALALPVQ